MEWNSTKTKTKGLCVDLGRFWLPDFWRLWGGAVGIFCRGEERVVACWKRDENELRRATVKYWFLLKSLMEYLLVILSVIWHVININIANIIFLLLFYHVFVWVYLQKFFIADFINKSTTTEYFLSMFWLFFFFNFLVVNIVVIFEY